MNLARGSAAYRPRIAIWSSSHTAHQAMWLEIE